MRRTVRFLAFALAAWTAQLAGAQIPGIPQIQAGVRLTFYSSSATIRGSLQQAVFKPDCDPTKEDCWVDANGRTVGQEDVPTAAGHGFTQLDILYLDQETCVYRFTSYGQDINTGHITTLGSGGAVSSGGTCSDFWIAPANLQQLQSLGSGFRVLRGPYTVGNLTFNAVNIGNFGAAASSHQSYDSVTGLLVVASSRSQGAAVPTIQGTSVVAGAGSSGLTYTQLLDVRQVPGVGIAERLPQHVLNANRLVYNCAQTTTVQGVGGNQTPCHYEVAFGQRNELWMHARARMQVPDGITTMGSVNEAEEIVTATGHGGFFAAPSLLAGVQAGAQLYSDPITGITSFVEHVDQNVVVINERGNAEQRRYVYDRNSGWLLQLTIDQLVGIGSYSTRLELNSVQ